MLATIAWPNAGNASGAVPGDGADRVVFPGLSTQAASIACMSGHAPAEAQEDEEPMTGWAAGDASGVMPSPDV